MLADRLVGELDRALRVCTATLPTPRRPSPAVAETDASQLSEKQRRESIALMRVNHAGEVAAQALYRGQALGAREQSTRDFLHGAADEELDHLSWCTERLQQLGASPSLFTPLWYAGSLGIGIASSLLGDRLSLGFVEEAERQVCEHLQSHEGKLPAEDTLSRRVVEQMRKDEAEHAHSAAEMGAEPLPAGARDAMRFAARIMTTLAARI